MGNWQGKYEELKERRAGRTLELDGLRIISCEEVREVSKGGDLPVEKQSERDLEKRIGEYLIVECIERVKQTAHISARSVLDNVGQSDG